MLTEKQFLKGMRVLMSHWKEYDCPADTVDVYREAFKNLDPKEFEQAVWAHINLHKWFPKVSEIMEQVLRLRNQGRLTAPERWGQLLALAREGGLDPVDIPTKRALSTLGGWAVFQFTPIEELNFRRKEFERTYAEALEEQDRQALLGLEGQPEQKRLEG